MEPSMKQFIEDLRSGVEAKSAFENYCWSRSVIPVERTPELCINKWPRLQWDYFLDECVDAVKEGKSDQEIEAVFWDGFKDADGAFSAMRKSERPTPGQLLAKLNDDDLERAREIFGTTYVGMNLLAANHSRRK